MYSLFSRPGEKLKNKETNGVSQKAQMGTLSSAVMKQKERVQVETEQLLPRSGAGVKKRQARNPPSMVAVLSANPIVYSLTSE